MPLRTTEDRDRRRDLRAAIDHTGYYPEVVADAVAASLADEPVVSFYVHHEPTFDRDEVRRHLSVVVLTPTRLVLVHTDEHAGDDLLPEPYTSTSTEAIRAERGEVGGRDPDGRQPDQRHDQARRGGHDHRLGRRQPDGPRAGGLRRPQLRGRPRLHRRVLSADDFSLRVSAAADGADAVGGLLSFAEQLSARTHA